MISEHETLDEMWLEASQFILSNGKDVDSRDGASKEIMGYSARLLQPTANFMFNPIRRMSPSYAAAEMLWYLSGRNEIDMIKCYAPQYERFASKSVANGAYGHRWINTNKYTDAVGVEENQLNRLRYLLSTKQETRQAVLTMYFPQDLMRAEGAYGEEGSKDIPCTLSLHFIVREKKLNLIATMRSNDVWLGMPYDVFCFTTLQDLIAQSLGLELGWYQHQATSLHVYERNLEKFKEAANPPSFICGPLEYVPSLAGEIFWDGIHKALNFESWSRREKLFPADIGSALGENSLLKSLCFMCATKWEPACCRKASKFTANSLMANYLEEHWSKE